MANSTLDLNGFFDKLSLSESEKMTAIEILTREGITVKQLQSTISDKDLEEIGIDLNARREISACNSGVSMQLLHSRHRYFSHLLFWSSQRFVSVLKL